MKKQSTWTAPVRLQGALFALALAAFTQMYALQGILPHLSADWEITASDAALTISFAMAGVAVGVIPAAWAGDRFGKLRCLKTSLAVSIGLSFLVPAMPSYEVLLGVRFISGITLAAIPVLAIAYVRETFSGRTAALVAGAYIAGMAAGGAGGRVIAGPLAPILGWRGAVLVAAIASLAISMMFYLGIPKTREQYHQTHVSQRNLFKTALTTPPLRPLYVQGFFLTGVHVGMYNYIVFRLQNEPFLLDPGIASLVFFAYFAGTVSSRFAGAWISKFGYRRTMVIGYSALLLGLFLMGATILWTVICGLLIYTAGFFITQTAAVTTVANEAAPNFRAQASAVFTICFYLGAGVIGWALGLVFENGGWIIMSMVIGGVIFLTSCLLFTSNIYKADLEQM